MKRTILFSLKTVACLLLLLAFTFKVGNANVDEERYYKYLKNVYEQKNSKLNNYLIDECKKYLELFQTGPRSSEVRYVMGIIYLEEEKYPLAVATFLKDLFLNPTSERMNDEREQIKNIISKQKHFNKFTQGIDKATEGPFVEKFLADKVYDYLKALYEINDGALYPLMQDESKSFAVGFPKSSRVEDVLSWSAKIYSMDKKFYEAIASYEKIESLFPGSQNIPSNKLTVAKIRYMELKDYEKARDEFKLITEAYAGRDVAGDAYFYLGELYQKKLKNSPDAVNNYQVVASSYAKNRFAVESLFRMSDIYLDDMKDEDKAIEALSKVGKDFPGDARAPEAFDKIAEVYSSKMKDYDSAITTYKKLAESYPKSPISPARLFKAATIAEKSLKDFGNAIALYEDVKGMFPDTKEAEKAVTKIAELKKKIKGSEQQKEK